jgi:hypothetical protein
MQKCLWTPAILPDHPECWPHAQRSVCLLVCRALSQSASYSRPTCEMRTPSFFPSFCWHGFARICPVSGTGDPGKGKVSSASLERWQVNSNCRVSAVQQMPKEDSEGQRWYLISADTWKEKGVTELWALWVGSYVEEFLGGQHLEDTIQSCLGNSRDRLVSPGVFGISTRREVGKSIQMKCLEVWFSMIYKWHLNNWMGWWAGGQGLTVTGLGNVLICIRNHDSSSNTELP